MANRPLWPEGVEVHSTDLQLESNSRVAEDNQRLKDLSASTGSVSGLGVSVNGVTATLVDIATGHGYCPNGEYIEVASGNSILGVALADYTLNVQNLVILMYTETTGTPRAHETLGNALNTVANRSFRVRVMTVAQYNALPVSNPDLTQDSQDRALIIANVLAQGVGTNLVAGNITRASDILWRANPVTVSLISFGAFTVTGVEPSTAIGNSNAGTASGPSAQPPLGSGGLSLASAGPGSTTSTLTYTAPGDAAGSPVTINSGSGSYTLTSGTPSFSTLTVFASPEFFPDTGTYTCTVFLSQSLYPSTAGAAAIQSAEDAIHRQTLGRLAPTTTNPHGVRPSDITGLLRISQGLVLGDGMPDDNAHSIVPRRIMVRANTGGPITLVDQFYAGGSNVITRVYVSKATNSAAYVITNNAKWNAGTGLWSKDVNGQVATENIYFNGGFSTQTRFATNNAAWSTWDRVELGSPNQVSGAGGIYSDGPISSGFGGSAAGAIASPLPGNPRFVGDVSSVGNVRWLIDSTSDFDQNLLSVQKYMSGNFGGGDVQLVQEFVLGASWDGTQWNRLALTGKALRIRQSQFYQAMYTRNLATAATWADGGWSLQNVISADPTIPSNLVDGQISFGTAGANTNPSASATVANTIMGLNTPKAWGLIQLHNAANATLLDGFNTSGLVTTSGGSGNIQVNLSAFMANSTYVVLTALQGPAGTVNLSANQIQITSKAVDHFIITLYLSNASNSAVLIDPTLANQDGATIAYTVFGRQ